MVTHVVPASQVRRAASQPAHAPPTCHYRAKPPCYQWRHSSCNSPPRRRPRPARPMVAPSAVADQSRGLVAAVWTQSADSAVCAMLAGLSRARSRLCCHPPTTHPLIHPPVCNVCVHMCAGSWPGWEYQSCGSSSLRCLESPQPLTMLPGCGANWRKTPTACTGSGDQPLSARGMSAQQSGMCRTLHTALLVAKAVVAAAKTQWTWPWTWITSSTSSSSSIA